MHKDVIYFISKEINNLYQEIAINGLKIDKDKRDKIINNLINLINNEKELYSYLTFDDISEIRQYFVDNFDNDLVVSERVINKCDEVILNKYVDEFYLDLEDEDFDEDDKDFDKKSIIYIQSLKRDIFYLKIFFLKKFLNNDGLVGFGLYLNDDIIKQCINSIIFTYPSMYPNIENELINNSYEINDFCLLNNLSCQLSLFDVYTSCMIKSDALKSDFMDRLNDILSVTEENVYEVEKACLLFDSLAHILSILVIDNSYLSYINKAFEKVSNDMIYYIFYDNLNELNKDKNNVKVLSLNDKFN